MRLGLFGGTFDPPHIGHLIAAQDALQALRLDRIVLVPAARPPHKQDRLVTPAAHRIAMLRLAAGDDQRFEIDALELHREGPSFTVDTLRSRARPGRQLFLLLGVDQYAEFDSWREPEAIRRLATLAVLRRAGEQVGPGGLEAGVVDVPVTRIDVASTLIRSAVAARRSIRYLVPDAVAAYIERHGLYREVAETAAEAGGTPRDSHLSSDDSQ